MTKRHHIVSGSLAAVLLGTQATSAWAQSTVPPSPNEAASTPEPAPAPEALPEVKVRGTTPRRTETQSTLSSTTRVSGQQAEELGLKDLRDALKIQGNVFTAPSNNGNNGITIRGVNSEGVGEPGANSRPLTTLVIDGAAQSIEGVRRGQRGTWDISEIEVVRGPQSTLQGRNTLAGSITVKTNDPSDRWEGAARLTAGERDVVGPALMLSGPLSDQWSFRIAAETAKGHKAISYSDPATAHLDDDEYQSVRAKLRFKPQSLPGLELKLTVSDTLDDPSVTAISIRGPRSPARNDGCPEVITAQDRYFCVRETAAERRRNKVRNHVLEASYPLSPGVTLSSVTAHVETDAYIDGTGSFRAQPYLRDEIRSDKDTTQLVRYSYAPEGSAWTGEAGVFLGRFGNTRDSLVKVDTSVQQDLTSSRRDRNGALFGEARWGFAPDWRLILGARYEREKSSQTVDFRSGGIRERSEYDSEVFLPKIGVVRDLGPQESVAFSVSSGYRGGFRETESGTLGRDVDPEFLTSFDLAYRSRWLDGKVRLNANMFYNRWRDQQVTVNRANVDAGSTGDTSSATVLTTTLNAGQSHMVGAEVDLAWRVARQVNVGASIGVLKTQFDDFAYGGGNLRNNEFPEAPRLSGGLWATARFGGGWFLSSNLSARAKAFATSDIFNDNAKRIAGYAVVGARFGYETETLSTVLWVDNLTDRVYLTGRDFRNGAYVADPRSAGVTVTARF